MNPAVAAPAPVHADAAASSFAALAAEHEALMQFLYLAPVGLVQTTLDGEIVMINPVSAQLLMPLSRDGNLLNLFDALQDVAPDLRHLSAGFEPRQGMVCEALRLSVSAGEPGRRDAQVLSLSLLKLDESRLMGVLSDITLQVRRERLLRQNETWLSAIMTSVSDYALVSLDGQGRIDEWNPSIGRVTGFTEAQAMGQPYSIFYPADSTTPERLLDRLRDADADGWSLDDGWRLRADGSRFWGSAMIAPLRDRDLPGTAVPAGPEADPAYCLVLRDISDKCAASEALLQATSCDHLTGLSNRRAFFEAAELELARWQRQPRPLSLLLFDADHFKAINDRHGHPVGDAVLKHLATRLRAGCRPVDVVARVGGEEFAVLLPSMNAAAALRLADCLRQDLQDQTLDVAGQAIHCTVSCGVAEMAPGVAGLDELLRRADRALYSAKAAGRNRVTAWVPGAPVNMDPDRDARRT